MPDSAPKHEGGREASSQPDPAEARPPSGLTRFLVDGPDAAGISRERLVEAVRALVRERDDLRRTRDRLVAESQQRNDDLTEHVKHLEGRLERESQAALAQADELRREVDGLEGEVEKLCREREHLRADRDNLAADRDMWKSCVKEARTRNKLKRLARRLLGKGGDAGPGS